MDASARHVPLCKPAVHVEAIRGEEESAMNTSLPQDFEEALLHVCVGATAHDQTDPKTGRNLERCEQPPDSLLAADEGPDLIGLELGELIAFEGPGIEVPGVPRGHIQPAADGASRQPPGSGDG